MATVTYTWSFTGDAEGLHDNSETTYLTFAYGDNDVRFSGSGSMVSVYESGVGDFDITWMDLGVPANSNVTDLQITAFSKRVIAASNVSTHALSWMDMYTDATTCVTGSNHLIESRSWSSTVLDSDYIVQAGGPLRTLTSPLPSTDYVSLKIKQFLMTNYGSSNSVVGYDSIVMDIHYEDAGSGATVAVNDALHSHAADEVDLDTDTAVAVASGDHSHTADEVTGLTTLAVASADHVHYTDTVTFSSLVYNITVSSADHGHTASSEITDLVTVSSRSDEVTGRMVISTAVLIGQQIGPVRLLK